MCISSPYNILLTLLTALNVPFEGYDILKSNWFQSEYGIKRVLGELKRCGDQFTLDDINNYEK